MSPPAHLLALTVRAALVIVLAAGVAVATTPPAHTASESTVITATVATASMVDADSCVPALGRTNFGPVTVGDPFVTEDDCTISFGSSNGAAHLRVQQQDQLGEPMWRYSDGATLDNGFSTDGLHMLDIAPGNGDDTSEDLVALPGGKLLVAGGCSFATERICIARFNRDGSPDASFNGGTVTTDINPTGEDQAEQILPLADGGFIIAGGCHSAAHGYDFCFAKYTENGSLVLSYGPDGTGHVSINRANDQMLESAVLLADGSVIGVGGCWSSATYGFDMCATRVDENGDHDTGFGTSGWFLRRLTTTGGHYDWANDIVLQPDGQLLMGGYCTNASGIERFCSARFSDAGVSDNSWGSGLRSHAITGTVEATGEAIVLHEDGRVTMVGGCEVAAGHADACIARYTNTGADDTSLPNSGQLVVPMSVGTRDDGFVDAKLLLDGSIITQGVCDRNDANGEDGCLVRIKPDGSLDTSFGSAAGVARISFSSGAGDDIENVIETSDGRIAVSGECTIGSNERICIGVLANGGSIASYHPATAHWGSPTTTSFFGVCLRDATGAIAPVWTPDATCTIGDPPATQPHWNGVPAASPALIATSTAPYGAGALNAHAHLLFGMRVALDTTPGTYLAPLAFTAVPVA